MSTAIDLTARYHTAAYMNNGPKAWEVDRNKVPIRQIIIHHWSGWYGPKLGLTATRTQEEAAIESNAKDHKNRLGIGPGYNYIQFPSGRLYAVGKIGTSRRHTSNRNPATGTTWNYDGVAICFAGNLSVDTPTPQAIKATTEEINWLRTLPYIENNVRIMGHRDSGFATGCPGNSLYARLADFAYKAPPPPTEEPKAPWEPPKDDTVDKELLEELSARIRRLERATFALSTPVRARAGNVKVLRDIVGREPQIGETFNLQGDAALQYAERQGVTLALTLDNLNNAVLAIGERVKELEQPIGDALAREANVHIETDDLEHEDVWDDELISKEGA